MTDGDFREAGVSLEGSEGGRLSYLLGQGWNEAGQGTARQDETGWSEARRSRIRRNETGQDGIGRSEARTGGDGEWRGKAG